MAWFALELARAPSWEHRALVENWRANLEACRNFTKIRRLLLGYFLSGGSIWRQLLCYRCGVIGRFVRRRLECIFLGILVLVELHHFSWDNGGLKLLVRLSWLLTALNLILNGDLWVVLFGIFFVIETKSTTLSTSLLLTLIVTQTSLLVRLLLLFTCGTFLSWTTSLCLCWRNGSTIVKVFFLSHIDTKSHLEMLREKGLECFLEIADFRIDFFAAVKPIWYLYCTLLKPFIQQKDSTIVIHMTYNSSNSLIYGPLRL